jgi:hydrogenase/urease accessory protein HupE
MSLRRAIVGLLLPWIISTVGHAHELRPAYLELRETKPGAFSVVWKTPMLGDTRLPLTPAFSGEADVASDIITRTPPGATVQTWTMHAAELRGQTLRIRGLENTTTDTLGRVEFTDGTVWTHRFTARQPEAEIPVRESSFAVALAYTRLGIEHILTGVDHLLFVLALVIITRGGWKLVKTVSAFTLSHSITLTAATLGFVSVPQKPVEAAIALSIVFVATEIVHARQGRPGLTVRWPWIVALMFGLLHGLGFAGALRDVGFPPGHIPLALLFFSVGVETGQLVFILTVLALVASSCHAATYFHRLSRRLSLRKTNEVYQPATSIALLPPYFIGAVAMFWVLQRLAAF